MDLPNSVGLFPTKSVIANEVVKKLTMLEATFGNLKKLVSDSGIAFTCKDFRLYCT